MNKKQQIIHIGGGRAFNSQKQYFSYLKKIPLWHMEVTNFNPWYKNYDIFLTEDSYQTLSIPMPAKEYASYAAWKIWFERHFEFFDNNIILLGHSLGGIFIAKYLSENNVPFAINQLHLIAPVYEDENQIEQLADFKLTDFPGKLLEKQIPEIHIYHSNDDTVVPITESEKYHVQIPESKIHIFEDRGHFLGEEFPELFENIKNC
jgi:predicted alpha/beta hydrolase family esterase